jgi:CarboxypepD_reg-like domain
MVFSIILCLFYCCAPKLYLLKIRGTYSIKKREKYFLKDSTLLVGTMTAKRDAIPISYGVLKIWGLKIGTIADTSGKFELKIPSGSYKLVALSVGYTDLVTKTITLKPNEAITICFNLGTTIIE